MAKAKKNTQTTETVITANDTDLLAKIGSNIIISDDMRPFEFTEANLIEQRAKDTLASSPMVAIVPKSSKSSKCNHQMPFTMRAEGNNPVMPNFDLLHRIGNFYPCDASEVAKVKVSSENYSHYRDVVFCAHVLVQMLASADTEKTFNAHDVYFKSDCVERAAMLKGKPISKKDATNGNHIYYGINDTLRDLENLGVVYATNGKNGIRRATTEYRMNEHFKALIK